MPLLKGASFFVSNYGLERPLIEYSLRFCQGHLLQGPLEHYATQTHGVVKYKHPESVSRMGCLPVLTKM